VGRAKGKKSGKTAYSVKLAEERRAFCRIVHEVVGHFYHFPFYYFRFEDRNEGNKNLSY